MKQWRKLTGTAASKGKPPLQIVVPPQSQPSAQQNAPAIGPPSLPPPPSVPPEGLTGEDSIEDEFRRGMQEVQVMRDKYDGLLKAAHTVQKSATSFSEAFEELSAYLADNFGVQEGDIGDVFLSASRVEEGIAQLFKIYGAHVKQTISTPTENLLKDLEQVEETKKQYEEKRHAYEQKLLAAKIRLKNGKSDVDLPGKEEFDEIAMTLGCRLLSLEQRRPRSLLTQLVRHHFAQIRLFKRSLQKLLAMEATVQRVVREKNISRTLQPTEWEADEEGNQEEEVEEESEDEEQDADEDEDEDLSSNTTSEPLSSQGMASLAPSGDLSVDTTAPVLAELQELPKEMPVEWSTLLSSLDQTLKGMGVETMDVGDAVFAMNAVLSAAAHSGKEAVVLRKSRSLHGSYSAPLSQDGFSLSTHLGTKKTETPLFQPSAPELARRLPRGYGAAPVGTAAYHVTLPPSNPSGGSATANAGINLTANTGSAAIARAPNSRPNSVSMSGPLPQPPLLDPVLQRSAGQPYSAPHFPTGLSAPGYGRSRYVSRSGPIPSPLGSHPRVGSITVPPFAVNMSGPLPSPSAVERAGAKERTSGPSFAIPLSNDSQHSSPQWHSSSGLREIAGSTKISRPRYYSGPLDSSSLIYGTRAGSIGTNPARRAEPLYKSGPIARSPLGSITSPSSSPPRISELYLLPPPPLNSSPGSSHVSPSPSTMSLSTSYSAPVLKAPPGVAAPLPLPTPNETSRNSSLIFPSTNKPVSRTFNTSKRPSVPTILSEGSEEGESPRPSSSPRLFRSVSLSSTESGASTVAPLRGEELSFARTFDRQSGSLRSASGRLGSSASSVPMRLAGERSTVQTLDGNQREQLLAQVSREDFQWRWLSDDRPNSVATVPVWTGMPPPAKEAFLKTLASAVLTRRSVDGQSQTVEAGAIAELINSR